MTGLLFSPLALPDETEAASSESMPQEKLLSFNG